MSTIYQASYNFEQTDRRTRKVTPALIAAVKDRLIQHIEPSKIILFGSRAQSAARQDSDIDLLVILADQHRLAGLKKRDRAAEVLNLFRYRSFGLDVIVMTAGEIHALQATNEGEWDLILDIVSKGLVMYDREQETERTPSPTHLGMVA